MEVLQGVPGQILCPDLALPHRDEHQPDRAGRQAAHGRCRPGWARRASNPSGDIDERREITWLEPLPDSPKEDPSDPSVIVESRESVRLAFVAALQHLSARQRAVLVLREVLQWKAAEVGEAIGASTAAVNSLLQRATGAARRGPAGPRR